MSENLDGMGKNGFLIHFQQEESQLNIEKNSLDFFFAGQWIQSLVSLDVASLFTIVSATETMKLPLASACGQRTIPTPSLNHKELGALLKMCTQETPFDFEIGQCVRNDCVSFGCPLGPALADFFMSHLENKLSGQTNKKSNPNTYLRYVDGIFAILKTQSHIRSSVLSFTYEEMNNKTLNFLDGKLNVSKVESFSTRVYIKATETRLCTNFKLQPSENYKASVVNLWRSGAASIAEMYAIKSSFLY